VEEAVVREVKEETGLDFLDARQFNVYSDPKRDPRFHTVSVVFIGKGKGRLKAASDAKAVKVFPLNNLPKIIAFDHSKIIHDFITISDYASEANSANKYKGFGKL
ncbi:MAG: NUDIX domain-containing protein, partial [Candidatus Omnitrophica bacterium]|nr:NUDIX domain-containing protein [Candidatus Omnitrophota bacterium]